MEDRMRQQLARRHREGAIRSFKSVPELQKSLSYPDFSSNDYLGLARCPRQRDFVDEAYRDWKQRHSADPHLGATGSRLLSGDSVLARQIEDFLARVHRRPAALLCNSGYDANLSILSSVPMGDDVVLLDELCHNSLVMGLRMSRIETHESFRHNRVEDLRRLLKKYQGRNILVVVESVYSMDGDIAPLQDILSLALEYEARVLVDEAHGLGLYGATNRHDLGLPTMDTSTMAGDSKSDSFSKENNEGGTGVLGALHLESHPALLCSIHTFGKAAGAHGAVICGSLLLKEYLMNYARPFIYSTALPTHSLIAIECSYRTILSAQGDARRSHVFHLTRLFRKQLSQGLSSKSRSVSLWPSPSPIQALVVPGNDACVEFCRRVQRSDGIVLYPIRAPTVPPGQERVRIILHSHNTEDEVRQLVAILLKTLKGMNFLERSAQL